MNADHTLDVSAIREAASGASIGKWDALATCVEAGMWLVADCAQDYDAAYIATMDPPTTLALLDALDAARAEVERLTIKHAVIDRMAEQRDELRAERDAIAEKIAVAIEAEMRRHDGAQIGFSGKGDTYAHAARIAREVGKV